MTRLSRTDLQQLMEFRAPSQCVSIYMKTHRAGREQQQDVVRLKNLVQEAEEKLEDAGMRAPEARDRLRTLSKLPENQRFWEARSDGLAAFVGPDFERWYRLPASFGETVLVGDRFHVKPLLPLVRTAGRFYVLALSQDAASLFEATEDSIAEVTLPEIARVEVDGRDETLQFHSQPAPNQRGPAMFHGHGGPEDRAKVDTLNYFHRVNDALHEVLPEPDVPLVLACVNYLAPIYREANSHRGLISSCVSGNPDGWNLEQLREKAWATVEPQFRAAQQEALGAYEAGVSANRASNDVREVVLASVEGRVDALFVVEGEQRWGVVEPEIQAVHVSGEEPQNGRDEELLDFAIVQTLQHGGRVFTLPRIPKTDAPLAALYRY